MNKVAVALCLGIVIATLGWPPRLVAADSSQCLRVAGAAPGYLPDPTIDVLALIGPPPALDGAAQRADLQAVREAQRGAHAHHTTARALADVEISCARVAAAAGEFHAQASAAVALEFLNRAALQAAGLTGPAKRYWHRARPYLVSRQIERLGDVAPGAALPEYPGGDAAYRAQRDHSSYPSGHAAFGLSCAMLLARMVPERRRELFERGLGYGDSRVVIGAHYPTDVAAGRTLAAAAVALMLTHPCFEEDFNIARSALRQALGLPEASPAP